jgi:hypothetical protein
VAKRQHRRRTFPAAVAFDGIALWLEVGKGAVLVTSDHEGAEIERIAEPRKKLFLNRTDKLLVMGPGVNDNAVAAILDIRQDGRRERLRAQVIAGQLAEGSYPGHVMSARGLQPKARRRAA